MTQVFLTTASTSPWAVPSDFTTSGHTVKLIGSGGNGAVGTTGTSRTSGGGGSGAACTVITYSSGTITPGTTTIAFLVDTAGNQAQTQWQSSTAGSGAFYEAISGKNAATTTGGAAPGSTTTVGTPTITYTATNHVGGAGGNGGTTLGGGGGGGAAGTAANGGAGGTPTGTGGGGGGGGNAANNGGSPSTATGGTGGNGSTGSGGTGNSPTGNAGTGNSGGGGANGVATATNLTGGLGGSGTDFDNTHGIGGGGGGAGDNSSNTTQTSTGGNGGSFGGGGGGAGGCRGVSSTFTVGSGAAGLIVVSFNSAYTSENRAIISESRPPLEQLYPFVLRPGLIKEKPIVGQMIVSESRPSSDHPYPLFRPGLIKEKPIVSNIIIPQETPREASGILAGMGGPNVAAPPQIGNIIRIQQYPLDHPLSGFNVGIQGPNVAAPPQIQSFIGRQQQPDHPSPFLLSTFIIAATATIVSPLIAKAEQPSHPSSQFVAGIQGPNVRPPIVDSIIVKQELPYHPSSQFGSGIPNVVPTTVTTRLLIRQEQPERLVSWLSSGIQGPDVEVPIWRFLVQPQYLPLDHPTSKFNTGIQGPNVAASPQIGALVVKQELPWHPSSQFATGIPNVNPPIVNRLVQSQFYPLDHPTSRFNTGIQGPDTWPTIRYVITKQEQPWHPQSLLWNLLVTAPSPSLVLTSALITKQELPADPSILMAGMGGPNVAAPPQIGSLVLKQEQPWHPSSFTLSSYNFQAPVVTAVSSTPLITKQEQPWHPSSFISSGGIFQVPTSNLFTLSGSYAQLQERRGSQTLFSGGPFVAVSTNPPERRWVVTTQESPFHPPSFLLRGVQPLRGVPPEITTRIIQSQYLPLDHPQSRFNTGIQGPNVSPEITTRIIQSQYLPLDHPQSRFNTGVQGPNVRSPITDWIIVKQEQPYHPAPFLNNVVATPSVTLSPEWRLLLVTQEQPWHPSSQFSTGRSQFTAPVSPPVTNVLVVTQEQPRDAGILMAGMGGPNVRPIVADSVIIRQEQPWHPQSFLNNVLPIVPTSEFRWLITAQEQPNHPPSKIWGGVVPNNVAFPPQIQSFIGKQELPWHPQSYTFGYAPPLVVPAVTRFVIIPQQYPDHPRSQFLLGVHPRNVNPPVTSTLIVKQEYPRHPDSQFWAWFRPIVTFGAPTTTSFIGKQEFPWHPLSNLYPGVQFYRTLKGDLRFISSPELSRMQVSTPLHRAPAQQFFFEPDFIFQPFGNSFSPMDAVTEVCTLTSNFDPWINPNLVISSIVSVTASVATDSLVSDPNAAGIIVSNSEQIVASPTSKLASRAVSYQVANLQPNVTYLIMVEVRLSDNQVYQMGSYLPCIQLQ